MKKLLSARDSEEFWQIFNEEREKNRKKQARLPFAKKVEILEKMKSETIGRLNNGSKSSKNV